MIIFLCYGSSGPPYNTEDDLKKKCCLLKNRVCLVACLITGYNITKQSWFFLFNVAYSLTDITSSYKGKPWLSRKNDKAVKIMIKTHILLWKTIEGNRRLRVRVRVRFLSFYSELAPTDPWCNMLQTLLGQKLHEEVMSDEHPRWLRSSFTDCGTIMNRGRHGLE